jgi:hypothetical protein
MKIKDYGKLRFLFLAMVAVALTLSVIGMMDISSTPYSGYRTSADYKVIRIPPDSPAALAGMQEGDSIIEIGGVPTENLHQLAQQPRPKVGEEQRITLLRQRIRHELNVQLGELPSKDMTLVWLGDFMALLMLALGLLVFWKRPGKASTLFFLCNFSFALAFMTPPQLPSFLLRSLVAVNFLLFITLGFAFFLHLTVTFPRPKPLVADTGFVEFLIYLPAPVMAVSYLALKLLQPKADLLVNLVLHNTFAILVLACLVLALAAILHGYWTANHVERSRNLIWILLGSLLGVIPPAGVFLLETFMPQVILPGWEYYAFLPILVSLSFAWAIWRMQWPQEGGELRHAA